MWHSPALRLGAVHSLTHKLWHPTLAKRVVMSIQGAIMRTGDRWSDQKGDFGREINLFIRLNSMATMHLFLMIVLGWLYCCRSKPSSPVHLSTKARVHHLAVVRLGVRSFQRIVQIADFSLVSDHADQILLQRLLLRSLQEWEVPRVLFLDRNCFFRCGPGWEIDDLDRSQLSALVCEAFLWAWQA